jgi:hypothetical protein
VEKGGRGSGARGCCVSCANMCMYDAQRPGRLRPRADRPADCKEKETEYNNQRISQMHVKESKHPKQTQAITHTHLPRAHNPPREHTRAKPTQRLLLLPLLTCLFPSFFPFFLFNPRLVCCAARFIPPSRTGPPSLPADQIRGQASCFFDYVGGFSRSCYL